MNKELTDAESHWPSFDRPGVVCYEIDLGGSGHHRRRAWGYGYTVEAARKSALAALSAVGRREGEV